MGSGTVQEVRLKGNGRTRKGIYVVLRRDRRVVVTDSLKDARRGLRAKYVGCLRRYGNVTELPPSSQINRVLESVEGIYNLEEFRKVLSSIYSTPKTVEKHYNNILNLSGEIRREPVRRKEEPPPIRIYEMYDDKLLKYIIRKQSDWYVVDEYDGYSGDKIYMIDFKNYYGLYDTGSGIYVSFRKDVSTTDLSRYVQTNPDILSKLTLIKELPFPQCENFKKERSKIVCREIKNRIETILKTSSVREE
ncbi:MAG: hypothetical protein ABIK73_07880 [candidate division WOR-3 bacterium]